MDVAKTVVRRAAGEVLALELGPRLGHGLGCRGSLEAAPHSAIGNVRELEVRVGYCFELRTFVLE